MPKLNKDAVKHRLAEANITSTSDLAEQVNVPWGSLKNGLAGRDQLSLTRIYRIAEQLKRPDETVRDVVEEIVAVGEGEPDTPPATPRREPKSPPSRQDSEKTKTAPKRNAAGVAA
ncbi:hypothetical protein VA596_41395 [Amycolatopsis sp., V23-08]|uniref:Helix-turn-helix transcriptional regulator n=1 Tax=Amycolatopsis heterodermiae TaxID=3110235 RepID=A0ABU5RID2_9PSEU|nr:hypothetical protein [Amycolatopsis sp., V23-08]MEA5366042.1 hypothetical protein [Amycolatopsis sp., V23-08]